MPPARSVWQWLGVQDDNAWNRGETWRERLLEPAGPFGWDGPWRAHRHTGLLKLGRQYVPVLFDVTSALSPLQLDIALEGQHHELWSANRAQAITDVLEQQIKNATTRKLIQYAELYWQAKEARR